MHHIHWQAFLAVVGAAYPTIHLGGRIFVENMPEPDSTKKTWYGAFYKTLEWFVIGNGKPQSPTQGANNQ